MGDHRHIRTTYNLHMSKFSPLLALWDSKKDADHFRYGKYSGRVVQRLQEAQFHGVHVWSVVPVNVKSETLHPVSLSICISYGGGSYSPMLAHRYLSKNKGIGPVLFYTPRNEGGCTAYGRQRCQKPWEEEACEARRCCEKIFFDSQLIQASALKISDAW